MITPVTGNDVRAIEARLGPKGRRAFTPKGWNDSLRKAGMAAGAFWISNYGVLRWNTGYAQNALGYRPKSAAKRARMAKGEAPFYSSGQFKAGYNSSARTVSTATKGRSTFYVVVPGGFLNFHPDHVAAFRTIPARESAAVAREFRRALIQAVQTGRVAMAAKKQAQAQARLAKKQATAQARRERRRARTRN